MRPQSMTASPMTLLRWPVTRRCQLRKNSRARPPGPGRTGGANVTLASTRLAPSWMMPLWLALLLLLSGGASAATMGEGLAAYQRGDYSTARAIVEPLAQSGDAHAQYLLGRMHARGEGVLQDFVIAHQWLNLSAARGNRDARTERDRIARQMTPSQIAEAQQLARAWKPSASSTAARSSSGSVSSRAP